MSEEKEKPREYLIKDLENTIRCSKLDIDLFEKGLVEEGQRHTKEMARLNKLIDKDLSRLHTIEKALEWLKKQKEE